MKAQTDSTNGKLLCSVRSVSCLHISVWACALWFVVLAPHLELSTSEPSWDVGGTERGSMPIAMLYFVEKSSLT
jgi:hypothetical protein